MDKTLILNNSVYQENERTGVDFQQWTDFKVKQTSEQSNGYGRLLRILMKTSFLAIFKDGFLIF